MISKTKKTILVPTQTQIDMYNLTCRAVRLATPSGYLTGPRRGQELAHARKAIAS